MFSRQLLLPLFSVVVGCGGMVGLEPREDGGTPPDANGPVVIDTDTDADNESHAYELTIPVADELRASGGVLSLLRLSNGGAFTRETLIVSPGAEVVSTDVSNDESIAVMQKSADVMRSVAVVQPGCEDPSYATGVELKVPEDFATIQAAIDSAFPGDTVRVGPGTYTEFLVMRPGVRLRGSGADQTILDAMGETRNLVDITRAPGVVIDGFTFRGVPRADIGCGDPDDPFGCSGNWYAAAIYGDGHWVEELAGVASEDALPAPACSGSVALVMHNVFENNFVAVMPYFHTRLILTNNVFRDNTFAYAANHLQDRGALLHNVFWNNERIAVGITAGYVDVLSNVIGASSTGLWQEYIQYGSIACNYFWQNTTHVNGWNYAGVELGMDGNVEADPVFANVAGGDFHLDPSSPAIDSGCAVSGLEDPDGSPADVGAYGGPFGAW
jgi:hypothetical protein